MILIDGKKVAAELREELKKEVSELKSKYNKVPGLTVILVGEDPASKIYVKNKEKFAREVGMNSDSMITSIIHGRKASRANTSSYSSWTRTALTVGTMHWACQTITTIGGPMAPWPSSQFPRAC